MTSAVLLIGGAIVKEAASIKMHRSSANGSSNSTMPRTHSNKTKKQQLTTQESDASAKREAESVQYRKRLRDNEARLSSGVTARGEPLTTEQMETLGQIVEMQRLKLAELAATGG